VSVGRIKNVVGVVLAVVSVAIILGWAFFLCVPFVPVGNVWTSVSTFGTLWVNAEHSVVPPESLVDSWRAGRTTPGMNWHIDLRVAGYFDDVAPGWWKSTSAPSGKTTYEVGNWHRRRSLKIPLWLVLPVVAAYPIVKFVIVPFSRRRRRLAVRCTNCGYSLIGNVTGRCPECGRHIDESDSESTARTLRSKPR